MNPNFIPLLAAMAPEGLLLLRVLGVIATLVLIPVGVILWKNQDRWFGRCEDTPSETSGGLLYGRAQTWLVYVGAVHVALWLALRW
jgi:hypothetical protein